MTWHAVLLAATCHSLQQLAGLLLLPPLLLLLPPPVAPLLHCQQLGLLILGRPSRTAQ
jgi:hypothetical protein